MSYSPPPEVQSLYRFYDRDGRLLYVGITSNIGARWRKHNAERRNWRDVATSTIEHFDTREEVEAAEIAAIEIEAPLWNIKHRPVKPIEPWPTLVVPELDHGLSREPTLGPTEVGARLGVSASTVRLLEKRRLLLPTRRLPRSGYRRYSPFDVEAFRLDILAGSADNGPLCYNPATEGSAA